MNLPVLFQCYARTYQQNTSEEDSSQIDLQDTQKVWNILAEAGWQSFASSMAGAMPYKMKVTNRLQHSEALSTMPHMQEKLLKLADEKLERCMKTTSNELDRHCVGRATGQMMQLIAAVENSSPNTSYTGRRKQRCCGANM